MKLFTQITGIVTFLILGVLALLFYKERAITFDMAFQEYSIILTKKFVFNLRFGVFIPQLVPYVSRLLNCPLRFSLMATSTGLVGLYFLIFLIIAFVLRQYGAAIIFIASSVLLVNDTFYWVQSELPQGLAWLILYYAYIEKRGPADISRRPWLHVPLLLWIQFFHPLLVFPIVFVVLFTLYKHYKYDLTVYAVPLILIIINFCIRLYASRYDDYESSKLVSLAYQLSGSFPSFQKLIHYATSDYGGYWIMLVFTIITLSFRREVFILTLMLVFTLVYLLLICITNRFADKFYLENMMLPLGIFVLLPFIYLLADSKLNFRKPALVLFLVIFASRFFYIYHAHQLYTARLNWYERQFNTMDSLHTQRMMLTERQVPMDTLVMSWASGYETMILSAVNGPRHCKSLLIDADLSSYRNNINEDSIVLTKFGRWFDKDLPPQYFIMRPGRYVVRE